MLKWMRSFLIDADQRVDTFGIPQGEFGGDQSALMFAAQNDLKRHEFVAGGEAPRRVRAQSTSAIPGRFNTARAPVINARSSFPARPTDGRETC